MEDDLDAVVALLCRGFPTRSAAYWRRGFARLRDRTIPADWQRYGVMLDCGGEPVGVVLQLFGRCGQDGAVRCNLSSWYVDPAFRSHTGSLVLRALRRRDVTYTSLSAAPHTVGTVEAVGFKRYAGGQFYSVPALGPRVPGAEVRTVSADDHTVEGPYADLLRDHAALGCVSLVVETRDGPFPFVFVPVAIKSGRIPLPALQLVFCAAPEDFARFARPIGRHLLRHHGIPAVVQDSPGRIPGLVGLFRQPPVGLYFRNGAAPRLNDVAYSERVFFGA